MCFIISALRRFLDADAMVKIYYYTVYGAKVAALHIVKRPLLLQKCTFLPVKSFFSHHNMNLMVNRC